MRLLIGYDGSDCAEAALDDLRRAGLADGKETEALIVSVAEVWLPPPPADETLHEYATELQTRPQFFKAYERGARAVTEAEAFAKHAQRRLQQIFPRWRINCEATYGSPAWEILSRAADFRADLVVVGSQGRSMISRLLLGSISQKVLTEATCSVRVARGKVEVEPPAAARLVIGFDGSAGSLAAVEAVCARTWGERGEALLIAAGDEISAESSWVERLADEAAGRLKSAAGLAAEFRVIPGNPKQVLVDESARWGADAIFLGANGHGSHLERFLLGSVSSAVAARAHCSVEVTRKKSA